MKRTNKLPIIPEFLEKEMMLIVTPISETSMYYGMPINQKLKFSLDPKRVSMICSEKKKGNVFSSSKKSALNISINTSFSKNFWGRSGEKSTNTSLNESFASGKKETGDFVDGESFNQRCDKYYRQIAKKLTDFKGSIFKSFKFELDIFKRTNAVLFFMKQWEVARTSQKKIKTLDEEKNYWKNQRDVERKEKKSLKKKLQDLVLEHSKIKSQNELLLEEKNFFMNHHQFFENLPLNNLSNDRSASIHLDQTRGNHSFNILNDRNRVNKYTIF